MARRSGHLPRMVEYHEDGCQWAEAAVPPSTDSETTTTINDEENDEGGDVGSPTSAAHMGAPPPLPPPLSTPETDPQHAETQTGDPVSPTAFMGASPIETIHENFF